MEYDLEKLLSKMTLEEKIGQMTQTFSNIIIDYKENNDERKLMNLEGDKVFNIGSISGLGDVKTMIELQKMYLEKSKHKIPLLNMMDVIHGYNANYQINLGLGCMFNPKIVYELSKISGKEAAYNGIHVTYSPMSDLTNDPRWGRFMEVASEDVKLTTDYVKSIVRGFQQDLDCENGAIGACVKHFAGYGLAQGGRDYGMAEISRQTFFDKHIKPYKAAIDENVVMVMSAFNTFDDIPCTGNYELMQEILRKKLGFEGVVISDHSSIKELVDHKVAKNEKEAAKIAIKCGIDIELATNCYSKYLKQLVLDGEIQEKLIDQSCMRILKLKKKLGLFKNPYAAANIDEANKKKYCLEHEKLYKKAARESYVLLKNENNVLPLNNNDNYGYIGTHLDSKDLIGFNACRADKSMVKTILEKLKEERIDKNCYHINEINNIDYNNVLKICENCNTIIMPIGEYSSFSGEGVSRSNIKLHVEEIKLIQKIKKMNKKIIVVIFNGRPLDLSDISKDVDGLIISWFPGHYSADALYEVMYNKYNFSGKLSVTFPKSIGQIPLTYDMLVTGREKKFENQEYVNGYIDIDNEPLYEFGYGLSYSKYEYSTIKNIDLLTFEVEVKNTSKYDGVEIVQLYINDLVASISRPNKQLKAYKRVKIKAGEKKKVVFRLNKEDFCYTNKKGINIFEEGEFEIFIAPSSKKRDSIIVNIKESDFKKEH